MRSCRIHRLHLCTGVRPPTNNNCLGYDTKQSDVEAPVMLELSGMQSTTSLPSFLSELWPRAVVTDRDLSMGQIKLNYVLMINWIVWNRTVYMYKNGFGIKLTYNGWYAINPNQTKLIIEKQHSWYNTKQWMLKWRQSIVQSFQLQNIIHLNTVFLHDWYHSIKSHAFIWCFYS